MALYHSPQSQLETVNIALRYIYLVIGMSACPKIERCVLAYPVCLLKRAEFELVIIEVISLELN